MYVGAKHDRRQIITENIVRAGHSPLRNASPYGVSLEAKPL